MSSQFNLDVIHGLQEQLFQHPVYQSVQTREDLQVFMSHHVYSVWDFMSLVKTLQASFAPTAVPWTPPRDNAASRFINSIVLEEECDEAMPGPNGEQHFASHFELYCQAMTEIGADPAGIVEVSQSAAHDGIWSALENNCVPPAAREFTHTTFNFIESKKLHCVAAAFALGREHIIPDMFRSLLAKLGVDKQQAPVFHYYLERHIHLDEDFHGPASLQLLDLVCQGDSEKIREAEQAASDAITARIRFWDGVNQVLQSK